MQQDMHFEISQALIRSNIRMPQNIPLVKYNRTQQTRPDAEVLH